MAVMCSAVVRREIPDGCHALCDSYRKEPASKTELLTSLIHNYGHTTT